MGVGARPLALVVLLVGTVTMAGCGGNDSNDNAERPHSLEPAYAECQTKSGLNVLSSEEVDEYIQVADDDRAITIEPPEDGGSLARTYVRSIGTCLLRETGSPLDVIEKFLTGTGSAMGQVAEYDGYKVKLYPHKISIEVN